jgi:hypothetical protein
MKMDIVASSGNDEFYTPRYAVEPLVKYINKNAKVWCPFDTKESFIVKRFLENGNDVINSHIKEGKDFFNHQEECDYIISNPPYSLKHEVFQKLFNLKKPFAMLVGVVGLFESQKRFSMFANNNFEIMYLNRRVSYFKSYDDQKPSLNPPFSSVWLTSNILPKQIVFEEIQK